jgi:two-component system nitrogen regulation response regulator GlnG
MPVLLVIDDEPAILHAFRRGFQQSDVTVLTAASAEEGLALVTQHDPDVVILDLALPDCPGLDVFRRLHQRHPKIPVIFITGHGTTDTAIEAMKLGAFDYLLKPLELPHVRDLVARACAISRLMRVPAVTEEEPRQEQADVLVGRCPAMQDVYKAIGRVAPQDVTVLIRGETGTGKELVARAIYHHSRRASAPFLAVNCAAIPETLLESELFGHERGAFTGAERKRIGKFEQCAGGTLFLDEIGDMTPLTQAKILRVLQAQQFERVGGNETIQTNVRIIAATNRDLEYLIPAGQFRSDLYYRLSVFPVVLPPLRERGDDLPLLIHHFLKQLGPALGKEVQEVAPETLDLLRHYAWPGNVRELHSLLKQALLHATGPVLLPEFLPAALRTPKDSPPSGPDMPFPDWERFLTDRLHVGSTDLYTEALTMMERPLLTRVLSHTGGNQLQAAQILGITRNSLRHKLRALGITIARTVCTPDDQSDP